MNPTRQFPPLNYLRGYPPELLAQVGQLITEGRLGETLRRRYPEAHDVRTDHALYDYAAALKNRFLRSAQAIAKVGYDNKLHVIQHALGTHTSVSRVQGNKLKAKREIRVASLFKEAPAPFLKMIVVHELAHLKERAHDKPFYALCMYMEPAYTQLEFDVRLWLTARELEALKDRAEEVCGAAAHRVAAQGLLPQAPLPSPEALGASLQKAQDDAFAAQQAADKAQAIAAQAEQASTLKETESSGKRASRTADLLAALKPSSGAANKESLSNSH